MKPALKSIAINLLTIALAVAIGLPVGMFLMRQFNATQGAPTPTVLSSDVAKQVFKDGASDLVLFASTTCDYCKAGIQMLNKAGAHYKVYYIDQDTQARKTYESMNTKGVPVLISKQQYIIGFSEPVWQSFLDKTAMASAKTVH
ncbi:MAG: Glutaredoxin [Pseudomonadota bacterium]|jgi:glutaredoxin